MDRADYQKHADGWLEVFRYVQNLGIQFSAGSCDQILLVPIFDARSYGSGGIFPSNWSEILLVAISAVHATALWQGPSQTSKIDYAGIAQNAIIELKRGGAAPTELKDIVLSCFSYGRVLTLHFRSVAKPSLEPFLREIWDFDGVGAPLPASTAKAKVVAYDQSVSSDSSKFHVPLWRWSAFPPGAPKSEAQVHGLIPECLLWHATTGTQVGK